MDYIVATRNTFLKKSSIQSSLLNPSELKPVDEGQKYQVEKYFYTENSHYKIELAYGAGTWFIYDTSGSNSHWNCSWEDTEENETEGDDKSGNIKAEKIIDTPKKINWSNPNIYISEYFRTVEVTKNSYNRFPIPNSKEEKNILLLAKELDKLREYWGSGLIVTSWFRPSSRFGYLVDVNRQVKGAYNSQHIYGRGVDLYPVNGRLKDLQDLCLQCWHGGVGKGLPKGFVHLDSRSGTPCFKAGKPTAVWNY